MKGRRGVAGLALASALGCAGAPTAPEPPAPAVRLTAVAPPVPVLAEGQAILAYELRIRNESAESVTVTRLEILGDGAGLATWEGPTLVEVLASARIQAGGSALAFLWLTLDPRSIPASLLHRLSLTAASGALVEAAGEVRVSAEAPLALGPPLRGGSWYTFGISNDAAHRRAGVPVGAELRFAQRFAIDWVRVGPDGLPYSGDPEANTSYRAYGQELLAVSDAVVAARNDGVAENVPGQVPPLGSVPLAGNFVLLDLGQGRGALYAHLVPGSLRVGVGDAVRRGDAIGLLGNSGNSRQPHLHFHVARVFDALSPSTLDADGLPFVLETFRVEEGRPLLGERRHELPLEGAVIGF